MQCTNCGHINEFALAIQPVDWIPVTPSGIVTKLQAHKYTEITGTGFATLFLTYTHRYTLRDMLYCDNNSRLTPTQIYQAQFLTVLNMIDANFTILGALALPSSMILASTDLSTNLAIMAFVTVTDDGTIPTKLATLRLSSLLNEGNVTNLNPTYNYYWDV